LTPVERDLKKEPACTPAHMIYTARQLEDLHRSNGHLVLPYGARLTPLAVDWAKAKRVAIGYSNVEPTKQAAQPINGQVPADAKDLVQAIKHVAAEVKAGRAAGGVFLVQTGAAAMLFANRCPSLRAVLGTCLESVEQGIQLIAANVLVIEYPYKTLSQVKNLLGRFARSGQRQVSDDVQRQLRELASCG
jgi:ribose 5-phosphate isomerase RpiB